MREFAPKAKSALLVGPAGARVPLRAFSLPSRSLPSLAGGQRSSKSGTREVEAGLPAGAGPRLSADFRRIPLHSEPSLRLQPRLKIGSPADAYEREADRIAGRVMGLAGPPAGRSCSCGGACPECRSGKQGPKEESLPINRLPAGGAGETVAPPVVHRALRSPGRPLDAATRGFFESRFGYDFRGVRVHADAGAARSARAMNAYAYTVGRDVVLGAGAQTPGADSGRALLAHELAHVVQQDAAGPAFRVQRQTYDPSRRPFSENCTPYIGMGGAASCDFYRCREADADNACGPRGYYIGYGLKYCERFTKVLRPRLSAAGKRWLDKTRVCLMEHVDRNIPFDAPCAEVKRSAFDSHPGCYVKGGLCFLPPGDWMKIMGIIDPADNDLKQVIVTGVSCLGNWLPLAFPATSLGAGGGLRGLMERDRRRVFGF